jgi:hypothetical protein
LTDLRYRINTMIDRTPVAVAGSAILSTVLGMSAFAAPAAAACERPQDIYVPGAEAHWTECHEAGRTMVVGWVKDNRADGKCGQVYAIFSNGRTEYSPRACPKDDVDTFTLDEPANDASVYLRTIAAEG